MQFLFDLNRRLRVATLCAVTGLAILSGCASTGTPGDPLEPLNRGIYTFNDGLDTVLVKPLAEVYKGVIPPVARTGVSNVFANMYDVVVALNNLLQGKFSQALSDTGRVVINTTAGLFGLFDIASVAGLEKHDEDLGQTLGYWGVGNGAYLVLPLLGPSTLRDAVGRFVDVYTNPETYIKPTSTRNAVWGLNVVSRRSELLDASRLLGIAALDDYAFVRDAYLQRRRNLIYDGNPPREKFDSVDASPGDAGDVAAAHGVNLRSAGPATEDSPVPAQSEPPSAPAVAMSMLPASADPETAENSAAEPEAVVDSPKLRVWLSVPR